MDYETGIRLDAILQRVEKLTKDVDYLIEELEKAKPKKKGEVK